MYSLTELNEYCLLEIFQYLDSWTLWTLLGVAPEFVKLVFKVFSTRSEKIRDYMVIYCIEELPDFHVELICNEINEFEIVLTNKTISFLRKCGKYLNNIHILTMILTDHELETSSEDIKYILIPLFGTVKEFIFSSILSESPTYSTDFIREIRNVEIAYIEGPLYLKKENFKLFLENNQNSLKTLGIYVETEFMSDGEFQEDIFISIAQIKYLNTVQIGGLSTVWYYSLFNELAKCRSTVENLKLFISVYDNENDEWESPCPSYRMTSLKGLTLSDLHQLNLKNTPNLEELYLNDFCGNTEDIKNMASSLPKLKIIGMRDCILDYNTALRLNEFFAERKRHVKIVLIFPPPEYCAFWKPEYLTFLQYGLFDFE